MKYLSQITALTVIAVAAFSSGCGTLGEAAAIDPATGKIKTTSSAKPTVIKSESLSLPKYKSMILVLGGDFFKEQTQKIGYFEKVVDRQDMEKLLIKDGKTDLVSDVTNLLSWKKLADNYKPFLVLKFDVRKSGSDQFGQLIAIDASTAEEVFTAEIKLDFVWMGVNDNNTFYPLFNSFIDWLDKNKR